MDIKSILSEQFKEVVSSETLTAIEEAFQQAVDEKSTLKAELEATNIKTKLNEQFEEKLSSELKAVDKDHSDKLKKLVEAIDTDHAVKLQKLVRGIDKKHTGMLKKIVEKYENVLEKDAKNFQERLIEEISNYIDLYIEKTVPTQKLNEAVSNVRASQSLNRIRKIVGITEEFVDSEIKEALKDGKNTIDSLRAELNATIKENIELKHYNNKVKAAAILEQKTADMPFEQKKFINRILSNKSPEYINENFSYVCDMFDRDAQTKVADAQEEVKKAFVKTPRVDRPEILEEKRNFNNEIERSPSSEGVSGYLNEMKKLSKFAR